jgi:hypothetical protein
VSITADAMNNLSDASGSILTLVGFKLAEKPADEDHPYGHARSEYLSGLAVAAMIMLIGFELAKTSLGKILNPTAVSFSWVTALVLVGTLLLNVAASLVFDRNRWFVANTVTELLEMPVTMYTLTEEAEGVIRTYAEPAMEQINEERQAQGKEAIATDIIFCADRDKLEGNTLMRYVLYTALALEKKFDWIKVSFVNVEKNPSVVQAYKATSAASIYPSDVIISCGSEYRVQSSSDFFAYSEESDTKPWSYNGEKTYAASILAVTCAEAPVACLTTNHGEAVENVEGFFVVFLQQGQSLLTGNCHKRFLLNQNMRLLYGILGSLSTKEWIFLPAVVEKFTIRW